MKRPNDPQRPHGLTADPSARVPQLARLTADPSARQKSPLTAFCGTGGTTDHNDPTTTHTGTETTPRADVGTTGTADPSARLTADPSAQRQETTPTADGLTPSTDPSARLTADPSAPANDPDPVPVRQECHVYIKCARYSVVIESLKN